MPNWYANFRLLLLGLCTEDLLLLGAQQVTSDVNTQLAAMANAKTAKMNKGEVTRQKLEKVSYMGVSKNRYPKMDAL